MSPYIKASFPRFTLLLLIGLLFLSAALILARIKPEQQNHASPAQAGTVSPARGERAEQLEAELVTVMPTGFEPDEITRPRGRFILAIDNRSGLDEVQLYLERETGALLNSAPTRKGKLKWRDVMDQPPGVYILRAVNDESWRCRITITSR